MARENIWVTETALATALNVSYMAEKIAVFGIVVGVALILTGIGLVILAFAVFGRNQSAGEMSRA
jgi:multisubunit Na+/H+ antiporter MnhC subunit